MADNKRNPAKAPVSATPPELIAQMQSFVAQHPEHAQYVQQMFGAICARERVIPAWSFWTIDKLSRVVIGASAYLTFLASSGFRIFLKRGEPVVVKETADSMTPTQTRRRINIDVKQYIVDVLSDAGFQEVIDALLLSEKFFTLDVLEMLPEIPHEKARNSIFSSPETAITFETELINEQPFISYEDIPLLSAGNTLGIVGKSGVGKSGFCELIASMAINPHCEPDSPITVSMNGGKILWIDTERHQNDLIWTLHRMKRRVCAEHDESLLTATGAEFAKLNLKRCTAVDERMVWLLEYLDTVTTPLDLVIIDGALDMVTSMNDEEQADRFYKDLQCIMNRFHCGIIITIHSGQNDEKSKPMGHIGGILARKCTSLLELRRSKHDRTIKEVSTDFDNAKVRSGRDYDIYAAFQWHDGDKMNHFVNYTPPDKPQTSEKITKRTQAALEKIFSDILRVPTKKALITHYQKIAGVGITTAKSDIAYADQEGWVQIINGGYSLMRDTF